MRTANVRVTEVDDNTDEGDEITQDDDMHEEPKPETDNTQEAVNQEQRTEEMNTEEGMHAASLVLFGPCKSITI